MAQQSTSLMYTFENENEAFRALTVHFVQKEIDYDYSRPVIISSIRMYCSV